MKSLEPGLISVSPGHAEVALELHADEPFLRDHRPGGHPLFGTVMGIELMVRAAAHLLPPGRVSHRAMEDLAIHDPLILQGPRATMRAWATRAAAGQVACRVEGQALDGPAIRMFDARLVERSGSPADGAGTLAVRPGNGATDEARSADRGARASTHGSGRPTVPRWPGTQSPTTVRASDVYALFFHGPAFQVVHEAQLADGAMWCELNPRLPPLTLAGHPALAAAPRWIELCLQSAGLLEIASNARMMIPHRIGRIEWPEPAHPAHPAHAEHPGRLFAGARYAPGDDVGVDIDLVDEQGVCHLRVRGYRTAPLPFVANAQALGKLHRALANG